MLYMLHHLYLMSTDGECEKINKLLLFSKCAIQLSRLFVTENIAPRPKPFIIYSQHP